MRLTNTCLMDYKLWPESHSWLEPPTNGYNLDLWPAHSWDDEELEDLKEMLSGFGPTMGQRSSGARGIELQIIISFAAGAIASGFFKDLGSDIYSKSRDLLVNRLFKKKKDLSSLTKKNETRPEDHYGFLTLIYPHKDGQIRFECLYHTEVDLELFLKEVHKVNLALNASISSKEGPFMNYEDVSVTLRSNYEDGKLKWEINANPHSKNGKKFIAEYLDHNNSSITKMDWKSQS